VCRKEITRVLFFEFEKKDTNKRESKVKIFVTEREKVKIASSSINADDDMKFIFLW